MPTSRNWASAGDTLRSRRRIFRISKEHLVGRPHVTACALRANSGCARSGSAFVLSPLVNLQIRESCTDVFGHTSDMTREYTQSQPDEIRVGTDYQGFILLWVVVQRSSAINLSPLM
jgi:hypothetical protein